MNEISTGEIETQKARLYHQYDQEHLINQNLNYDRFDAQKRLEYIRERRMHVEAELRKYIQNKKDERQP